MQWSELQAELRDLDKQIMAIERYCFFQSALDLLILVSYNEEKSFAKINDVNLDEKWWLPTLISQK